MDVSMRSESSVFADKIHSFMSTRAPLALEKIFEKGVNLYNKHLKLDIKHQKTHFLEVLRMMGLLFEPNRKTSITSACLSPKGLQEVYHSFYIEHVLPNHSEVLIREMRLSELPSIFHNLSADSTQ